MDPGQGGVLGCGTISDADLAAAIRGDWSHRSSGALANHVLEILDVIRESSENGAHVLIETTVNRPDPLPVDFPASLGR